MSIYMLTQMLLKACIIISMSSIITLQYHLTQELLLSITQMKGVLGMLFFILFMFFPFLRRERKGAKVSLFSFQISLDSIANLVPNLSKISNKKQCPAVYKVIYISHFSNNRKREKC